MNKKRFYMLVVAVLVISNVLLLALFINAPEGHGPKQGPKNIVIEKLHFDKNQIAEYEKLIKIHRSKIVKLEKKLNASKNQLYSTLNHSNANNDSLLNVIGQEVKNVETLNYEHFLEIKNLCKEDQLADFNKLTKQLTSLFSPKGPKKK